MKRLKKLGALLAVLALIFAMAAVPVSAASGERDGVKVTATANQREYLSDSKIMMTLVAENTNDKTVSNLELTNPVPRGYRLSEDTQSSMQVEQLRAGEAVALKTVYEAIDPQAEPTSQSAASQPVLEWPELIAIAVAVLLLALSITVLVLAIRKKQEKKLVAILLSVVMFALVLPIGDLILSVRRSYTEISLEQTVNVEDAQMALSSKVRYGEIASQRDNLVVDKTGMVYDASRDIYLLSQHITGLKGTMNHPESVEEAICTVLDINGNKLFSQEITPAEEWSVPDMPLVVGVNEIQVTVTYEDGQTEESVTTVNNINEENMENLEVDRGDDDEDGVLNFLEEMYHTDPQNPDTDGDGLTDYEEMAVTGTDPTLADTDGNGTSDGEEDLDGDGLTNFQELHEYNTNPIAIDSDGDGISDGEEVNTYHTDPNNTNTDGDGRDDNWEVMNGYDPTTPQDSFPTATDSTTAPEGSSATSDGEVQISAAPEDSGIGESTPGYIGSEPVQLEVEEGHTADLTLPYDSSQLEEGETPTMYFYNEETQCLEPVEGATVSDGTVTGTVSQSGIYVLLNHRLVEDVWNNDIIRPSQYQEGAIDVVFVIDRSASMDSNDPQGLRKTVTKEFIEKLRDGVDHAALVQFTSIGELVMPLTDDKQSLYNTIDGIENSDGGGCAGSDTTAGTNGSAGIRQALNELNNSAAPNQFIIFLTDGADTEVSESYDTLIAEAVNRGIVIHTVGLVGSGDVDTDLLRRIASGTGGNYYLATASETGEAEQDPDAVPIEDIYDEIESVTIDTQLDSNGDGISDYYTQKLCENAMGSGTGQMVFGNATYEEVQASADLDGDGLLNGEEIQIVENDQGVYALIHSYPTVKNSDSDNLDDYQELRVYGTSPLKNNLDALEADVTWATTSDNFVSEKYRSLFDSMILGTLERGSVYIGNIFFGTSYDQALLYENSLIHYFDALDDQVVQRKELSSAQELAWDLLNSMLDQVDAKLNSLGDAAGISSEELEGCGTFLKNVCTIIDQTGLDEFTNFYEENFKPLENLYTKENLQALSSYVRQLDGAWLKIDPSSFANAEDYYNVCARLFDAYNDAALVEDSFSNSIQVTKQLKTLNTGLKVAGGIGLFFDVVEVVQVGLQSYKDFATLCANLDLIAENIYLLDAIEAQSDDANLRTAASNLKYRMQTTYAEDMTSFTAFLGQYQNVLPITNAAVGEAVHGFIGTLGAPGMIVELIRAFGNIAFNMADVAQACSELYAVAKSGDILGSTYQNYLEAGNGSLADGRWVFYSEDGETTMMYFLNLLVMRNQSETKMIEADQANSFLLEWLFADIIYRVEDCEANQAKCQQLLQTYQLYQAPDTSNVSDGGGDGGGGGGAGGR